MNLELLSYGSIGTLVLAALWALGRYGKLHNRIGRGLAWYIGLKTFFELLMAATSYARVNNLPFFYLYEVLETLLIMYVLSFLPYMKKLMPFMRVAAVLLVLAIVAESVWVWRTEFNTFSRIATCMVLIVLCLIAFFKLAYSAYLSECFQLPDFWFLISVMINLGAHALIMFFINYSMSRLGDVFSRQLWLYNYVTISLSNLLLIAGIWVASKPIRLTK